MPSSDRVFDILQDKANIHEEFPYLFFDSDNYEGTSYPIDKDEFPNWAVHLSWSDLNLNKVQSLYVPPHAILEIYSVHATIATLAGPAMITKTSAYPLFWRNHDDSHCDQESNPICGTKVQWNSDHIRSFFLKRHKMWNQYLHDTSSKNQFITLKDKVIKTDMDAFFEKICPSNHYNCQCVDAFHQFKKDYPSVDKVYINNLENECDPHKHYVPKQSKIGQQKSEECIEMLGKMVKSGTWKTLDQKEGLEFIMCAGQKYANSTILGYTDKTQIFDDELDKKLERENMNTDNVPLLVVYILASLFTFLFLYVIFYFLDRPKCLNTPNIEPDTKSYTI